MMRLKQLLGILCLLVAITVAAAAAGSQLTGVNVAAKGAATTVTLQTSGPFTHNEYRPADNLLLVDLTGVSAAGLRDKERALATPGVKSYRVLSYKGASGAEVTRLEFALADAGQIQVNEVKGTLQVTIAGKEMPKQAAVAPAAPALKPVAETPKPAVETAKNTPAEPAKTAVAPRNPALKTIRNVGVSRGKGGVEIEIEGVTSAKAMKLESPDRIVLDIADAVPTLHNKNIRVNAADLKTIRIARYQLEPPVTRIVLDLAAAREFELVPGNNRLTVKLQAPAVAAATQIEKPVAAPTAPVQKPIEKAPAKLEPAVAKIETPKPTVQKPIEKASAKLEPAVAKIETPKQTVQKPVEKAPAKLEPAVAKIETPVHTTKKPSAQAPAKLQMATAKIETPVAPAPATEKPQPPAPKPVTAAPKTPAVQTPAQESVFVEAGSNAPKQQPAPKPADPIVRASDAATTVAKANLPTTQDPMPSASASMIGKPAVNLALEQQQQAPPKPAGPRYTGEPISVNLKDVDLKDFFRLIHDISGLNVVLDPGVKGTVTLVLDDVPWDQALDVVLQNNNLDRQLQGNVLRIATVDSLRREADLKRAQAEAQALAVDKQTVTRFLSYAHAKDVMPTVKRFLSQRGDVIADERLNALIIQDIPSVIPELDRLLVQLDRKTQEVEIEARVVAATRKFAREIGFQLGFGWGNGPSAVGGAGSAGNSPITVVNPGAQYLQSAGGSSSGSAIPLFSNLGGTSPTSGLSFVNFSKSYRLDAILTMAESKGLLKILSRPRVVTQNNITAVVKQGFRLPIVTQAQLNGPPTVSYVEAVLRLTVTPQITVENTIFLAVDVENTTPDKANAVQGNPALLTQQAQTQVLVTDGGTVVIGGVIQTQNSVNTSQVPLLGDIPVLGNLFKRRTVDTSTQELIFFITPKIIQT